MNGDDGNAARLERAMPIREDPVERLGRSVDQAVERHDAAETASTDGQAREIGQHDRPSRFEGSSLAELTARRVGGDNRHSSRGQEAGNVRGAGADLEHGPTGREAINESIEQQSVERLAVELVSELASVQIRNSVERRRDVCRLRAPVLVHAPRRYAMAAPAGLELGR